MRILLYGAAMLIAAVTVYGGEHAACSLHEQHMKKGEHESGARSDAEHGAGVDHRHDSLGMSHEASRHNFRLYADGGAIELRATKEGDAETIQAIRDHLSDVVKQFERGEFTTPQFVHGHAPDGIETMAKRKETIAWKYEELPDGGRIRIRTADAVSLAAIHDFLEFQVIEHRTGDTGAIEIEK